MEPKKGYFHNLTSEYQDVYRALIRSHPCCERWPKVGLSELPSLFNSGAPHMRYQRLVTVIEERHRAKISKQLWQGGRIVLERLSMDKRVQLGPWGRASTCAKAPCTHAAPQLLAGQVLAKTLSGLQECTVYWCVNLDLVLAEQCAKSDVLGGAHHGGG